MNTKCFINTNIYHHNKAIFQLRTFKTQKLEV